MAVKIKIVPKEISVKKISKEDALYLQHKNTDYQCKDCIFYKNKKCALYNEQIDIQPFGSCNYWMRSNDTVQPYVSFLNTTDKKESGYVEHEDGFTCGRCEYFLNGQNECKKVKGVILESGCCNFWESKSKM